MVGSGQANPGPVARIPWYVQVAIVIYGIDQRKKERWRNIMNNGTIRNRTEPQEEHGKITNKGGRWRGEN